MIPYNSPINTFSCRFASFPMISFNNRFNTFYVLHTFPVIPFTILLIFVHIQLISLMISFNNPINPFIAPACQFPG